MPSERRKADRPRRAGRLRRGIACPRSQGPGDGARHHGPGSAGAGAQARRNRRGAGSRSPRRGDRPRPARCAPDLGNLRPLQLDSVCFSAAGRPAQPAASARSRVPAQVLHGRDRPLHRQGGMSHARDHSPRVPLRSASDLLRQPMPVRSALQINLHPLDARHVVHTLAHQLEAWGGQVERVVLTVDTRQSRNGRYSSTDYEEHRGPLFDHIEAIARRWPKIAIAEVDYSPTAREAVRQRYFATSEDYPDKAFDGGPFHAYFYGLLEAQADYVVHMDSDMLFGGGSQTWLDEAIGWLEKSSEACLSRPLPGPTGGAGTI